VSLVLFQLIHCLLTLSFAMGEVLAVSAAVASFAQLIDNSLRTVKAVETCYNAFRNASTETESIAAQCRQVAVRLEYTQLIVQSLTHTDILTSRLLSLVHSATHLVWVELVGLPRDCPKLSLSQRKKRLAWALKDKDKTKRMSKKLELADQSLSSILQVL
jgi:DNA repair ATPase RecN